jgi:DNA-binding NarL/FixJ family response regulator
MSSAPGVSDLCVVLPKGTSKIHQQRQFAAVESCAGFKTSQVSSRPLRVQTGTFRDMNPEAALRPMRIGAFQPTAREREVLQLICAGCTTKEIAGKLGTSFKTAACHRSWLLEKAGVHNSIELFHWAIRSGFVALTEEARDSKGSFFKNQPAFVSEVTPWK